MHSVAKRREPAIVVAVTPASPVRPCVDLAIDIPDEPMATEEELRAWSDFDRSRPTTPSPSSGQQAWRLPKRYQGVFKERYILMILALTVLLFIASTCQMDTRTELEEIKRMHGFGESAKPIAGRTGDPHAKGY
ncbi:hypothetical protein LSCM4_04389 [Leishmania orientalis]|uniref:Uncharacterized protein n=1 Tax=Leishmania orientalis TaxID=2249476 RepID=A0A836KL99_9TRYP|nr:hypothetical protein LSCM4_04389 [Leishmania orientalis]